MSRSATVSSGVLSQATLHFGNWPPGLREGERGERVATLKQYMTVETSGIIANLFDNYKQFCHDGQNGIMRSIIDTNESAWLRRDTHVCKRYLGFMFLIH